MAKSTSIKVLAFCFTLVSSVTSRTVEANEELPANYNFHYQKSGEMLKAASSNAPYSRYEVVESAYNPDDYAEAESANFGTYDLGSSGQYIGNGFQQGIGGFQQGLQGGIQSGHGFGGGLNQFGRIGAGNGFGGYSGGVGYSGGSGSSLGGGYIGQQGGLYSGGHGGGLVQGPYLTGGSLGHQGGVQVSGGYVDKNQFESAKKNVGDENLEKVSANAGSTANQGSQGFNQGAAAQSSAKGDSGYYKDETANKNLADDGKQYQGATNFDKAGKINQYFHKNVNFCLSCFQFGISFHGTLSWTTKILKLNFFLTFRV